MNIELSLLNFSNSQLKNYLIEIKKSNLPNEVKWELSDLINTAKEQVKQYKDMGWVQ